MPLNNICICILMFFVSFLLPNFSKAQDFRPGTIPAIPYGHKVMAPPGMVYVPGGTTLINYDQSTIDTNSIKKISLTSFFMDQTETTNLEYRSFVNWVVDSIAIMKYLKDEKYFFPNQKNKGGEYKDGGAGVAKSQQPADSMKAGDSTNLAGAMKPMDNSTTSNTDTFDFSKRKIDWSKVDHNKIFNTKDDEMRSKLAPMLDENGNIKKEMYNFSFKYVKNISSTTHNGKNTIKIETLNVYPEENVWSQDLTNATTDMYVENYFKASAYNDYPVVGVTWSQARAYCYWRSLRAENYYNMPEYMKSYRLVYTLPSEAQWVYAAQGFYELIYPEDTSTVDTSSSSAMLDSVITVNYPSDSTATPHDSTWVAEQENKARMADSIKTALRNQKMAEKQKTEVHKKKQPMNPNLYVMDYIKMLYFFNHTYRGYLDTTKAIDSTFIHRDPNGMLMNFKQNEGDYWEDGAALTTPVTSFAPNEYGLYNMEGNVAEWTQDAYSPSAYSFVSDLNPVLLYDADSTDADVMKRKVLRGGSFMGNAKSLSPFYRDVELQGVAHCYVGFRCILQAPETIRRNTSTRNKTFRGKRTPGKFSGARLPEIH